MNHLHQGCGRVPSLPFLHSATKELIEIISTGQEAVHTTQSTDLSYTASGCTPAQLSIFLHEALQAGKKHEPTVETGNKYGVSQDFHTLNADLIMSIFQKDVGTNFNADNRSRALQMYQIIFRDSDMRNRNVLHSGMLDSCVIGNLLNFFKHMFGVPFGGHGTDGNEVLSLCLYSYRQKCLTDVEETASKSPTSTLSTIVPLVLYMDGKGGSRESSSSGVVRNLQLCAQRLVMNFQAVASLMDLKTWKQKQQQEQQQCRIAVVLVDFEHPNLDSISNECLALGLNVHIHINDAQWRSVFIENASPIHYELPKGVQSLSIEDGLFFG